MRESNFAFPAQNKACVCITSQLYDRRALDTTSPLPLFNSLTHLTYLTSTSPRIREIMTMDGGLERLVRILHEFCMCPPPPENPAILYGLTPPNARLAKLSPALNPPSFDKHAAYRFSLAFQCIVNIGVRGSEPIRSRVVQAGTLDVVGCILEAWLANKGFAVGPSSSATGIPRETREQRQQRRLAQLEQKQREEAAHLQRALQRQLQVEQMSNRTTGRDIQRRDGRPGRTNDDLDDSMEYSPASSSTSHILLLSESNSQQPSTSNSDTDVSADNSIANTPQGSGTPTGSVVIPSRDRSGTIIARPVWDNQAGTTPPTTATAPPRGRRIRHRELPPESPLPSTDVSRAETETEDDGDQDIDMDRMDNSRIDSDVASASASPSPERRSHAVPTRHTLPRRAVGIVSDEPANGGQALQVGALGLDTDAHIIINDAGAGEGGVGVEVGVEDGIVSLEPNDDFAMGAPPGAPGAMGDNATPRMLNLDGGRRRNAVEAPDVTPRAAVVGLPLMPGTSNTGTARTTPSNQHTQQQTGAHGHHRTATIRGRPADGTSNATTATTTTTRMEAAVTAAATAAASLNNNLGGSRTTSGTHHHRDTDSGPYRDEDVLLSLQLLAYLSKYPHVRQAFYKPRVTFHPASVNLPGARFGMGVPTHVNAAVGSSSSLAGSAKMKEKEKTQVGSQQQTSSSSASSSSSSTVKEGFLRAFTNVTTGSSSNRGKDRAQQPVASSSQTPVVVAPASTGAPSSARHTNVFSLVERFTFKPSSTETDLPNPPPRLPPEIQYWAGVIMRNACRKDDSRGGIRQCANMMCGKWETYPREFAKCRRCRKAKYCGKECQSTAWSEGHRFWCSAKDADEDNTGEHSHGSNTLSNGLLPHQTNQSPGGIPITVQGGHVETPVPITNGNTTHSDRERDRRQRNQGDTSTIRGHPPSQPIPSNSSSANIAVAVVGPVLPTTAPPPQRTDASSMSRDRTVQPIQSMPNQTPGPSHVRSRPTMNPVQPQQPQDPTNSSQLTFHVQTTSSSTQQHHREREPAGTSQQSQRRRAETITGATIPPMYRPANNPFRGGPADRQPDIPRFNTTSLGRPPPSMASVDWPMSPISPEALPRDELAAQRHRIGGVNHPMPPRTGVEQDDMVLG